MDHVTQTRVKVALSKVESCLAALTLYGDMKAALVPASEAALELKGLLDNAPASLPMNIDQSLKRAKVARDEVVPDSKQCPGRFPRGGHTYVERKCVYCKKDE